ncbi:transposase [Streptomyces anulatus]|uniref:transposase n=1 Tax=Streptomyces anulatus TaxID=1892 RepID=UPI002F910BBB
MDVETRRPIDLLPDREASSLAAWLAQRPGVEVVCRDRAPFFAEGAAAGAPQAVQVADRWHLWHNLSEAVERSVAQHRRCLQVLTPATPQPKPEAVPAADPSGSPWPRGHRFADRTRDRHAAVHALLKAGHSRRSVQRQLGMTWRTVKQFADVATPEELFTGQWQNRPSVLDDYKPYLDDRWNESCTNAWKLWEEIVPLGYRGSYQRVRAYLHDKRTSPRPVTARPPSPRAVAGWVLRHPDSLTEPEQLQLKAVCAHRPELDALTRHVRSFAAMVTGLQGERLPDWLDAVRQDDLPSLHTLAAGIDRDRDAVIAGLTLPWNSVSPKVMSIGSRCSSGRCSARASLSCGNAFSSPDFPASSHYAPTGRAGIEVRIRTLRRSRQPGQHRQRYSLLARRSDVPEGCR